MPRPAQQSCGIALLIGLALLWWPTSCRAQVLSPKGHGEWVELVDRFHQDFRSRRFEGFEAINTARSVKRPFRSRIRPEGAILNHVQALELILAAFDRHAEDEGAVQALLDLASLGLEQETGWDRRYVPVFRELALDTLAGSGSVAVVRELMVSAGNEELRDGIRSAALLALGRVEQRVVRATLLSQLDSRSRVVRLAAAIGLTGHPDPRDLGKLALRLSEEPDPLVLRTLIDVVRGTARDSMLRRGTQLEREVGPDADATNPERSESATDPASTRGIEAALFAAHSRFGDFGIEVDQAIVELCANVRSARSIPLLIRRLREAETDEERRPLAPRLREVLVSLTGAPLSTASALEWNAFWLDVSREFALPDAPRQDHDPSRTTTGFFGIEVRGARVVFLIDTSGSMRTGYRAPGRTQSRDQALPSRLQTMIHELREAVRSLPAETLFDVVAFASREDRLFNRLVPADTDHRDQLDQALESLVADGGTNIHGALDSILPLEPQPFGSAESRPVDEIFLLSDGEPSAGTLTEPDDILRVVRDANRWLGVRIHTISMASGGSEFLKRLAEENGGTHVTADS